MLDDMDKLVSLCKRRGFIFPSSEVYGGINGFWDYGPLGVELKRNIKDAWWRDNVRMRDDMVGLDCSIIMNPRVWEASGHVGGFSDPMVDCRATKERYRADQLYVFAYVFPAVNHKGEPTEAWLAGLGELAGRGRRAVPRRRPPSWPSGSASRPSRPRSFPTCSSPSADREKVDRPVDRRPRHLDRAPRVQPDVQDVRRGPGKRDERRLSAPRDGAGDLRQFQERRRHRPGEAPVRHRADRQELSQRDQPAQLHVPLARVRADGDRVLLPARGGQGVVRLLAARRGSSGTSTWACGPTGSGCATTTPRSWRSIRRRRPTSNTLSRSASASWRGSRTGATTTSSQHMKFSGKDLSYFDEERKERFVPHVIEPSAGADRATLAFLCEAYTEDEVGGEARTVLKFHPRIAPVKAAVFPLVKRDGMPEKAEAIYRELKRHYNVFLRRERGDRPAVSAAGRGGHAVLHHRRQPEPDRRHRDDPRPRQLPAVAGRRGGRRPGARRPAGRSADPGGLDEHGRAKGREPVRRGHGRCPMPGTRPRQPAAMRNHRVLDPIP